ncbi:NACHT, LRR and PYD domains-containing protein 12-like [Cyprinodon tularosa]|uniref:NACHT, LRR and PYD domains-containing protein 12-like n=1 Tax=Cyprinodon tularosa TaxID=77115 RepID=UPI0018E23A30|nr:NACHT, LRR and PYD domains-containing protein 12-like [Cyprinodon tularosa]XP_038144094.1 NACHT, LRR and PYD domains-containing protein 12-like [Cyprinodon tularosa]XP_038144095.1 NACHT, LRR and PYD domains-containing protein 12-like [Cyprinodon tularosa]
MTPEDLLNILDDLANEEFIRFKWFLQKSDCLEDLPTIKKAQLQMANREDTVDLMVQTYRIPGAVKVTKKVLEKINRNDLLKRLPVTRSGTEVNGSDDEDSSGISGQAFSHTLAGPLQKEDLIVPVPEPHCIRFYQQMLQSNFQDKFMCTQEGWAEDKQRLVDIYTEVYITAGCDVHINTQHEVRQIENILEPAEEIRVKPRDMFNHPSGEYQPIKTILTNGIAGIGKTFLVHKFVLDWAAKKSNQNIDLIFPFTFRQLNPLRAEKFSLAQLIHECIPETVDIKEEALNYIFKMLQSSGNSNYDKSRFKLLFVFDGLDESRLHLDLHIEDVRSNDVTNTTTPDVLLRKLINGKLLRSARIWITSRPAAASQIPRQFVSSVNEVRGFTDLQKETYFRKRFRDEERANKIISHIKGSQSLHIMCHIPVFCWITATVLEDMIKTRGTGDLPKSLTEMYTEFLVFQMDHSKEKYGSEMSIQFIKSLAKLAYQQLEKGNLIFYEKDLIETSVDLKEASVISGVFTEIFKEQLGRKRKEKMFSFVHLSVQEFLAAVYVRMCLSNSSKHLFFTKPSMKNFQFFFNNPSSTKVDRIHIDKALRSPNGHLDLFLRFFLGLSLPRNQDKLKDLLEKANSSLMTNEKTVQYIKKKIGEDLSVEKRINLFHCLNELNDHSLVEEIQLYLRSGRLSTDKLSPAQWSALLFILLSTKDLDVFDLKKYSASEEALLRLLPVVKSSCKALLSECNLTERCCEALGDLLISDSCGLKDLDLSKNILQDSGLELLLAGKENPLCKLEILRLYQVGITGRSCQELSSVLSSNFCCLRELDLSSNDLQDSGVKLLCAALGSPQCSVETLRLNQTSITESCCEELSSVFCSQSSKLKQVDLNNNDLGDQGMKLLSVGLQSSNCVLETLRLSGCMISVKGCSFLEYALQTNPSHLRELDLSFNHPGDSGKDLLLARLEDPLSRLEILRLEYDGQQRLKRGLKKYFCELTLDLNTAHIKLQLSHGNRKVATVKEEQPYPDHPNRFHFSQLLCTDALVGRSYWEVEWEGVVHIAVSYIGIGRKGTRGECLFGRNEKSWSLSCSTIGYAVCHNQKEVVLSSSYVSNRVAVYVDFPAGVLSFYRVSSDILIHLYTFNIIFTEPLYAGFGFWYGGQGSSAYLISP